MVETGFANAIVTGLVTGSVIALGAIGLALVYSIAEVPNFAHGELLTIGAYTALLVNVPHTVPVLEALTTGARSLGAGGAVALFLLATGAVLGTAYLLGGRPALEGEWWPVEDPPGGSRGAVATHVLLAGVVGAAVVAMVPSIWSGMLLAGIVLAAAGPLQEKVVYQKFRDKDVDLATMLIAALGVSFVLRFGTQAVFGGQARDYTAPPSVPVAGVEVPLSAAQFFDFYLTGGGLTLEVINTGAGAGEEFTRVLLATYSWPVVVVGLLASVGVGLAVHRWRDAGGGTGLVGRKTVGPRLIGTLAGLLTLVAVALLLAGSGSVPDRSLWSTRIRLSVIRGGTLGIALLMMAVLHVLLQETKLGVAMRASSDNLDLAKITGINTDRVMMATWIIAGAYAAVGGVMVGLLFAQITPNMGFFLLLPMFAAVILGGIGSAYGAILGAFIVGLSMDVGIHLLPVGGVHRISVAFAVLLVVLLVKPEGIVGGS